MNTRKTTEIKKLVVALAVLSAMSAASAQEIGSTKENYSESVYQKFSDIRKDEIRFETKVVRAGNLKDILDYPLGSVLLRPSFAINIESNGTNYELKFSQPNSRALDRVFADTIRTMMPDMITAGGQYRIIEVVSHLGSSMNRHASLEICSNSEAFCVIIDPTMAFLETVVYAAQESTIAANEVMLGTVSNSADGEYLGKNTCSFGGGGQVNLPDLPFKRGDYLFGGVGGTAKGFSVTWSCGSPSNCNINTGATVPISNSYSYGDPITNTWKVRCSKLDFREAKWKVGATAYSRVIAITGCGVKRSGSLRFSYSYNGSGSNLNYDLDFNGDSTYFRGGLYQRYCAFQSHH